MNKFNQKGMSSILFAMVFATVLSLMAIGFATLTRNDTRQTLDQTLGYQAQYAAESGVNQAIEVIKTSPTPQSDCQTFNIITGSNDAKVTCVVWEKAKNVEFSDLGSEPQPFKASISNSGNPGGITFSWDVTRNTATDYGLYGVGTSLPNPINYNNMPIVKFMMLTSGSNDPQIYYIVPTSAGGSGAYGTDGAVYNANCGPAPSTHCDFTLTGVGALANGSYMSVSVIGRNATKLAIATTSATAQFDGVQWQVDSTAIAQDITKRVQARVNPIGATWRPSNTVSTDEICKDIKVDGINSNGISGTATCVNRITTP